VFADKEVIPSGGSGRKQESLSGGRRQGRCKRQEQEAVAGAGIIFHISLDISHFLFADSMNAIPN
jgi:hypothetical protein